jgi:preprotein translocase subunit YajC
VGYLIILVALFVLMWFLLIRPQRRRSEAQMAMQDRLRAGDEIITAGGLHGSVKAIEDDIVHVEIAPGTLVRVDRRAVAAIVSAEESEPEDETETEAGEEPVPPSGS